MQLQCSMQGWQALKPVGRTADAKQQVRAVCRPCHIGAASSERQIQAAPKPYQRAKLQFLWQGYRYMRFR